MSRILFFHTIFNSSRFGFGLSAIAGFLIALIVHRVLHIAKTPERLVSRTFESPSIKSSAEEPAASRLLDSVLTTQQCARLFAGKSGSELHLIATHLPTEFWTENSNRGRFLGVIAARFSETSDAAGAIRECHQILMAANLHGKPLATLLAIASHSVLGNQSLSNVELEALLRELGQESGLQLIEAYLERSHGATPLDTYKFLATLTRQVGWEQSQALTEQLLVIVASTGGIADAKDLLQLIRSLKGSAINPAFASEIICGLMRRNRSTAIALLAELAAAEPRLAADAAFRSMLSPVQLRDVAAVMSPSTRDQFLSSYAGRMWNLSPLEASSFADAFPPSQLPANVVAVVSSNILQNGGWRLKEWLKDLSPEQKKAALSAAYNGGGSMPGTFLTPAVAIAWLDACEGFTGFNTDDVKFALALSARKLALPELLKKSALVNPGDKDAVEALAYESADYNLGLRDPAALRSQIESATGEARDRMISSGISSYLSANRDCQATLDWLHTTTDPAIRQALTDELIMYPSPDMPVSVRKELCLERLKEQPSDPKLNQAVAALVTEYARSEPSAAFDVLKAMPNAEMRSTATTAFVKAWAESDPVSTSEWLAEMPAGKTRDLAVKELVLASRDDPERALANAANISDKALRREATQPLLDAWKSLNPEFVRNLLATTPFSPDERAEFLKSINGSSQNGP